MKKTAEARLVLETSRLKVVSLLQAVLARLPFVLLLLQQGLDRRRMLKMLRKLRLLMLRLLQPGRQRVGTGWFGERTSVWERLETPLVSCISFWRI